MTNEMHERLYTNPNFVWLDRLAVEELLKRRKPGSCDPLIVYNNLLRWVLYQLDRTACAEVDELTGADIPLKYRLEWLLSCHNGAFPHIAKEDLEKYLKRGTKNMPWNELSQKDFLEFVAPYKVMTEEELLNNSLSLMLVVVNIPKRLDNSAFHAKSNKSESCRASPCTPRKDLSRRNSLRSSIKEIKLRKLSGEKIPSSLNIFPQSLLL